ncbi:MAG: GTP pyrophosphokinase [Betaproteobacteria bacterium HGW-Betaproteobacteria-11]|nr:MAG: GTP pyrophosphokinase [Betaproteobacteria bacterium HGW-Betaproteobacteria-11]
MVSVVHALDLLQGSPDPLPQLTVGLDVVAAARVAAALDLACATYERKLLSSGEPTLQHALGMASIAAGLQLDGEVRCAALLFSITDLVADAPARLKVGFGETVAGLVANLHRLASLRPLTRAAADGNSAQVQEQIEVLRKMLIAMADDLRVVLLRLASRVQTLRFLVAQPGEARLAVARESLSIYAPLANRLGLWPLKWEMEDLAFRYLEPETYKRIAQMLDEKRLEREAFITVAVARLRNELAVAGIRAEVVGRPKHIYSIWNKMRGKKLAFEQVHDVRALRIIVDEVKDCYTALGLVYQLWPPIHGEFDDYISHPKGNDYRSLHTAVIGDDGRALEVQIRTHEMHRHAELGVAAHWRYKEAGSGAKASGAYEDKISWLRQLLSWRDEITDSAEWVEQFRRAALDDTIYVLTPQGKVLDLARGATPLDFAYRLHTDLGHRCRGAKVDGHMVPLDTPLQNGQRVEILTTKSGGPSRDWLHGEGYLATPRARQKVRQWFVEREKAEQLAAGRAIVMRELQRLGATQMKLSDLAVALGLDGADGLFLAAARGQIGARAIEGAVRGPAEAPPQDETIPIHASRVDQANGRSGILIVGVDKLLTQIGRCCKPMPPDAIIGFVTRGKGISVHRIGCVNFRHMARKNPERVIEATWGKSEGVYAVDLLIEASDRQGLLKDVSDVLSRQRVNVSGVKMRSRNAQAKMGLTVDVPDAESLQKITAQLAEVSGVSQVRRR